MKETERSFLQRIYVIRAAVAVVWAVALVVSGGELGGATTALLIAYPAIDVVASLVDARDNRVAVQWFNAALSTAAVAGLAIASTGDAMNVLRVFGAWALISGLVQLGVGLRRRARLAGQIPMLLSGAISAVAGAGFIAMGMADNPKVTNIAGYAVAGAVFYLISARALRRREPRVVTAA
jgi:hypothetical protein